MKTALVLSLTALLSAAPVSAQVFRPEAVNGAVIGGVAGAIIGHNSGDLRHNGWRGAAYGAGAGLLIGSLVGEAHDRRWAHQVPLPAYPRTYIYRHAPAYYHRPAYTYYGGYGGYGGGTYVYDDEVFDGRPNYAANGLLLGALAGAVIGHNSGDLRHNGWRGAAYGATAGYLLGAIAENQARRREAIMTQQVVSAAPASVADTAAAPPVMATATEATAKPAEPAPPMAAANSLFGR